MSKSVTNEKILEHLKALQEEVEMAQGEIFDELRAIKDQVLALERALGSDGQEERDEQAKTELAQKVATLDN